MDLHDSGIVLRDVIQSSINIQFSDSETDICCFCCFAFGLTMGGDIDPT